MALVLAPFLIFCLLLYPHPPLTGLGLPLIMGATMGLNIQNRFSLDQIAFFDMSIGTIIGPIISVCVVHMVRAMSPDMTAQRMLSSHYKAMRESIWMIYGTAYRTHLRSMLDRIGVLNTKEVQSVALKAEINNALIESSAVIDFTRLQELSDKLSNESPLVVQIAELQLSLDSWFKERAKGNIDKEDYGQVLNALDRIAASALTIGDEDIRHRIQISVNNIRNSICHDGKDILNDSALLVGA